MRAQCCFRLSQIGLPLLVAFVLMGAGLAPSLAAIAFKQALDDTPLDVTPLPGEEVTDAVKQFHETGVNAYDGNAEAIATGKSLYTSNCQLCHSDTLQGGAFGAPSLIDDKVRHARVVDDVGMFEVIYGGAAGAMAGFKDRLTQDQILQIIAYVRSMKQK
jgi:cytochrome c-L